MNQENKLKSGALLIFILTAGVFGIINTEMGVIGILPLIDETFHVTVPEAGWTVSIFALVVAVSAPITPLLFSRFNRKKVMLLTMGLFTLSNIISMLTTNFTVLLIARALPAFLHPVYVSMALTVAASTGDKVQAQKNVLARSPIRSMALLPFVLLGFYICLFFLGEWLVAMAIIILSLGIFAGYGQNTMQYMITHAAPEAPDFANALYLLSANLGTMLGTAVCGAFITAFDTRYSVFGSLLFLVVGIGFVVLRIRAAESKKQIEIAIAG